MKKKKLLGFLAAMACLTCFAGCKDDAETNTLESAKSYLDSIYKAQVTVTAADTELYNKVTIDGVTYNVAWSVNVESGVKIVVNEDGTITLDIDENAPADVNYVLTATITDAEGNTIQTSYDRTVPKFKELTWAEFTATEDEKAVVIKGVISGIVNTDTKHELYLQDADGGYYVYNLEAAKMEGLAVGMEIRVRGIRDTYYGVNQIVDAGVEILNATPVAVTPNDITATFNAAESLQAEELTKLQSTVVTIKGVTVLGQDASDPTYFNFKLGNKQAYIRLSSSACMLSADDQKAFKDTVAASKGYAADVTGVVSIYNNKVYLIPLTKDAFSNVTLVERNDAEKVAFEKEFVKLPNYGEEIMTDLTLPTAGLIYSDVTVSWASSNESVAKVDGDKLIVSLPKDAPTTVTLTATITSGEASDTLVFENLPVAKESIYIPEAITAAPEVGKTYKMYLYQGNLDKILYLEGSFDGKYLKTTANADLAADVTIVAAKEGTFYLQKEDGAYININISEEGSLSFDTVGRDPVTEYKWSADHGTIVTADESAFLGTYKQFETVSASAMKYISSNFAAKLCTFIDKTTATDEVKATKELKDLNVSFEASYALATEITVPTAAQYFDGVTVAWTSSNTAVASFDGDQLTISPAKAATTVTLTVTVTSGTVTKTQDYTITVDELTQFITVINVAVDTPYTFFYYNTNDSKNHYFAGYNSGDYYFSDVTDISEAVNVYLETATDGYYAYYMDGETKNYLVVYLSGTHTNCKVVTAQSDATVFAYDTELNTLIATLGETQYFLGSFSDKDSFRPSNISYAQSGNYISHFATTVKYSEITDETKIVAEKQVISSLFDSTISEATTYELPAVGETYSEVAIAWEVTADSDIASITDGVLSIAVPEFTTTVTVTATFTVGETTVTEVYNIEVLKNYTQAEIVDMAYALENYATLPTNFTLTGTIIAVDYSYSTTNKNLTVTMVVEGKEDKPIQCYKLVGDSTADTDPASLIGVGNKITVTGILKNYKGTIEFDQGCQLNDSDLEATVSNAAKVASEKYLLELAETEFTNTASVELPATGTTYTDVAITWATETAGASIDAGVLTVAQVSETTTVTVTATLTLGETTYTKDLSFTVTYVSADSILKTYTFSEYTAGTQYAENEVHQLDEYTTVTTDKGHFTTQLRLYSSSTNDSTAIIACTNVIDSIVLNCGNKVDVLNVYGSVDGVEYTLIQAVSVTSTSYNDYTVNITDSAYKYLKLDVAGTQQIRIAYMTITMAK